MCEANEKSLGIPRMVSDVCKYIIPPRFAPSCHLISLTFYITACFEKSVQRLERSDQVSRIAFPPLPPLPIQALIGITRKPDRRPSRCLPSFGIRSFVLCAHIAPLDLCRWQQTVSAGSQTRSASYIFAATVFCAPQASPPEYWRDWNRLIPCS